MDLYTQAKNVTRYIHRRLSRPGLSAPVGPPSLPRSHLPAVAGVPADTVIDSVLDLLSVELVTGPSNVEGTCDSVTTSGLMAAWADQTWEFVGARRKPSPRLRHPKARGTDA